MGSSYTKPASAMCVPLAGGEGRAAWGARGRIRCGEQAPAARFAIQWLFIQQPCPGWQPLHPKSMKAKGNPCPKASPPHADTESPDAPKACSASPLPLQGFTTQTAKRHKGHLEALANPRILPKCKKRLAGCLPAAMGIAEARHGQVLLPSPVFSVVQIEPFNDLDPCLVLFLFFPPCK